MTAACSIIGSSFIIYKCLTKKQQNNKLRFSAEYNRILIALSLCDLIVSSAFFCSTWAFSDEQDISVFNLGNEVTCNIQGAMAQIGSLGGISYNTCLAIYFCLFVRAKIKGEDTFDVKNDNGIINNNTGARSESDNENNTTTSNINIARKEILLHFCILFYPVVTAIVLVIRGNMNPTPLICWITEFPRGCEGEECIRGKNHAQLRLICLQVPVIICVSIIIVTMILLHRTVKKFGRETENNEVLYNIPSLMDNRDEEEVENPESNLFMSHENETAVEIKNDKEEESVQKENTPNLNHNINKALLKIRRLSLLYLFAALSVWVPLLFQTIITKLFVDNSQVFFCSLIVSAIFGPLQGFFNAMIFFNFNLFMFLYKNMSIILVFLFLSVLTFFLICEGDMCWGW